jgi:hypothetical protein
MMGNLSGDLRGLQGRPFQFSLRGLMVVVLGVALGLSVVSLEKANWADGLATAVSAWMVLGLISQVRDLWGTFHGRADLSSDERWGWRFAVFWRVAVTSLLAGHYIINLLLERKLLALPEVSERFWAGGADLRNALFCVSLLVVLGSVPHSPHKWAASRWFHLLSIGGAVGAVLVCLAVWSNRMFLEHALFWLLLLMVLASVLQPARTRPRSPWGRMLGVVCGVMGVIGAVIWCLCVWSREMDIHYLVQLALEGIEASWSPQFAPEGVDPDTVARSEAFFWRSLLAAGFLVMNLVLMCQLADQWTRGRRRRLIWAVLLALSLAMTASYPIWFYTSGLHRVSPMFAYALEMGPLHRWVYALLLVVVLVTAATCRMIHDSNESARGAEVNWRQHPRSYYHERRPVIMLLVAAAVVACISSLASQQWNTWTFMVESLYNPFAYLIAAGFLLALQKSFWAWFQSSDSPPPEPPRLPLSRFCAIWLAMFVTAVFGIPTIAWFSFAIWLGPWYR